MAGRGTARGLMSAAHVHGDDFEVDVHVDSAGHRFGATAHGGSRRCVSCAGRRCETVVENEDEGPEAL